MLEEDINNVKQHSYGIEIIEKMPGIYAIGFKKLRIPKNKDLIPYFEQPDCYIPCEGVIGIHKAILHWLDHQFGGA